MAWSVSPTWRMEQLFLSGPAKTHMRNMLNGDLFQTRRPRRSCSSRRMRDFFAATEEPVATGQNFWTESQNRRWRS
jgi:hypothetical protein